MINQNDTTTDQASEVNDIELFEEWWYNSEYFDTVDKDKKWTKYAYLAGLAKGRELEREECANLADDYAEKASLDNSYEVGKLAMADMITYAIRARGEDNGL